jgi:DNA-binding LacI/PurR family transcriptional regulator
VTGADVARLAGVSEATVSYVLNDKPTASVAKSTRQRVRAAAADLGCRPNSTARSLRVGRSDVVIALLPDLDHSVAHQRSLQELAWALKPHGLSLVVHPTPMDSAGTRELWRAITPVCAFAFVSLRPEDVQAMHAAGIQVAVSCSSSPDRRPWELKFGGDDVGRAQAEHLIAMGHTHLGLALPVAPAATAISAGRRTGLAAATGAVDEASLSVRHIP